jgi:maltooligosyltrehalose trehalohydrolase
MPVAEFPGNWGWGYDGVSLYAPHHSYGGPAGLKRLVNALHRHGLAVILDVVYNHLGPCGNYLGAYGPYFTDAVHTPWGNAVNLNGPESDEVRGFFLENAVMWLRDYHFDGLRLDAVHALVDTSAMHFLEELAARVKELELELERHLVLVAESHLNDPRLLHSPEIGGYGLSALWSDDFHHALHTVLTGEHSGYYADFGSLQQLAKAIEDGFVYDGCYSSFRRRRHGRPLGSVSKNRLFGYLQNHDQIGNRARGERISALADRGRQKIGAALVLLGPFIPLIFQGEEWSASTPFPYFTNHTDHELGRVVLEGRRREFAAFGWDPESIPDPQDPATFLSAKLNWREAGEAQHRETMDWYSNLIRLRKRNPELCSSPDAKVDFDEQTGFLLMRRRGIAVACNLGSVPLVIPWCTAGQVLLVSTATTGCNEAKFQLAPGSTAILLEPDSGRDFPQPPIAVALATNV